MIPIIYDKNETAFISNGLGRLRDCISAVVSEERNGVYELDFEYPVSGANYDLIQVGRIVGVTHDDTGDIQPFDIVSFKMPIDGIVEFHCVHISYRQAYMTVTGSNINSLSAAFTLFGNATPANPFTYSTDKTSTGYLACADGVPRSVRQMLGGIEGSVLDAYGGEYEFDKWNVILHSARGQMRDFTIRYGVNMLDYNEDYDATECYSSCIPYWTDGTTKVVGSKQTNAGVTPSGREQCIPLDVSDKFEAQPTKAQVESMGLTVMNSQNPTLPARSIEISFVRLQDAGETAIYETLLQCRLCDTINVIFPDFNSGGQFKIVKTEWNVLRGKYETMELGTLSVSLAEALGISNTLDRSGVGGGSVLDYYPVGSYYETSDSTFDPNVSWGGTWVLETAGKFHMSAGTGWGLGTSGGSPDAVIVKHNHTQNAHHHIAFKYKTAQIPTGSSGAIRVWDYAHSGDSTANTNDVTATNIEAGVDGTNKNLPPYIVVNRWHRTG